MAPLKEHVLLLLLVKTIAWAYQSSVVSTRRLGPSSLSPATEDAVPKWCSLSPDRSIELSHPMSIERNDRYFGLGSSMLEAISMTIDYINTERCGVSVDGRNLSIALRTIGDNSDAVKHAAIGAYIVNQTDFLLAGYTSSLTEYLAPIAQENKRVMVAGGSSATSVFRSRDFAFGILPAASSYLGQALAAVNNLGATKLAYFVEEGFSSCESLPMLVEPYDFTVHPSFDMEANPDVSALEQVIDEMKAFDPEVVISCVRPPACGNFMRAMRNENWSPKAVIFMVCFGSSELEQAAGTDIAYMMGAVSWSKFLPPIPDAVTGWTPLQFSNKFEKFAFTNATYQTAAAAASVSVLVQAIENADSLNSDLVRQELASNTFDTVYGKTVFNEDGQNGALSVLFQYDANGEIHTVYPAEVASDAFELVYPMPSWHNRDCRLLSSCEAIGGACNAQGMCICENVTGTVSYGVAAAATCILIPEEDFQYIADAWIAAGYALVGFQTLLSFLAISWTLYFRKERVVKAAQPFFLVLISVGCFVLSTAIIPAGIEGEYRMKRDETSGLITDVTNPDIENVDLACMSAVWLAGIGFAVIFSALFAKIWRVKKTMDNAVVYKRRAVQVKDVVCIIVGMVVVEALLLALWQLNDPLQWERRPVLLDENGFTIKSVGSCESDNSLGFALALAVPNGACLVYALWLSYLIRFAPSEFAEGKWITISTVSIFQILMLAIPVLIIAEDDRTAFYFVEAGVISLLSASVTLLIFVPKIWRVSHGELVEQPNISAMQFETSGLSARIVSPKLPQTAGVASAQGGDGVDQPTNLPKEPKDDVMGTRGQSHGWGGLTIQNLGNDDHLHKSGDEDGRGNDRGTPLPAKDDVLMDRQSHGWGGLTIACLNDDSDDDDDDANKIRSWQNK